MADNTDRAGRSASQTVKALLELRELILGGGLRPGDRISELAIVERLGVSRTPVRAALVRLADEGFLEDIPSGGFAVKGFSERDVFDAIDLRGLLEGMAARLAAERGLAAGDLAPIRDVLAATDALIAESGDNEEFFSGYVALNGRFHEMLWTLSDSPVVIRQIERVSALPFASHNGFVMAQSAAGEARAILAVAQDQHRCVIDAIEVREGARAEALMREHARLASRNLRMVLRNRTRMDLVKGGSLIRG
jgi:GntR family transcriptional regulator of vanillate catabolism